MSASLPGGPGTPLTVTFDRLLYPEVGRPVGPWFCRQNNGEITVTTVAASGLTVVMGTTAGGLDFGPDVVSYAGSDPLIRDLGGTPVAAFTNFPLT